MMSKSLSLISGICFLTLLNHCTPPSPSHPARPAGTIQISVEPGQYVLLKTTALELRFDPRMVASVTYLKDGNSQRLAVEEPSVPSHYLTVAGTEVKDFPLDFEDLNTKDIDTPLGRGKRLILKGISHELPETPIEKILSVEVYDHDPGAAIIQATYRNLSTTTPLKVDAVFSQAYILSAALTDPSLKPHDMHAFFGNVGRLVPYVDTTLPGNYSQDNYTGRTEAVEGVKRGNGGLPFVDLWTAAMGLSIGHIEPIWQNLYMPVQVMEDGRVFMAIKEVPGNNLLEPFALPPGASLTTVRTFVRVHSGDFYETAARYAEIMQRQGLSFATPATNVDYLAAWCTWNSYCTVGQASKADVMLKDRVLEWVDKLPRYGIDLVIYDAGWFDNQGDWRPNPDPRSFPGGEPEFADMIDLIHTKGHKVMLWISYLTADPWSEVAKAHPEWMILKPSGEFHMDRWSGYTMCPSLPEVQEYHSQLARRFVSTYGADGFKVDGMYTCPPCYNPAHGHADPNESSQDFYKVYKAFYEEARKIKPETTVMICPCGTVPGFDVLPYMSQTIGADPPDLRTVRRWGKLFRALKGSNTPYSSDRAQLSRGRGGMRLPTAVGSGAIPQLFLGEPPDAATDSLYLKWIQIYNREMISRAHYANLYDMYYDSPEIHVLKKDTPQGDVIYYSIYADDASWQGALTLRGLEPGKTYRVVDYVEDRELGTVQADNAVLHIDFTDYLLIKCVPQ